MSTHTTNYKNTLIVPAEDCPAHSSEIPPVRGEKRSVANYQFELLADRPYQYTSDDIIFLIHALRKDIPRSNDERAAFFSKGQPCLRTSPLARRYGWYIHNDATGKIALIPSDSDECRQLLADENIRQVKAMRTAR